MFEHSRQGLLFDLGIAFVDASFARVVEGLLHESHEFDALFHVFGNELPLIGVLTAECLHDVARVHDHALHQGFVVAHELGLEALSSSRLRRVGTV